MKTNVNINVAILGKHPVYSEGLRILINDMPEFSVIDSCSNFRQLLLTLNAVRSDIAIIDLSIWQDLKELTYVIEHLRSLYPDMLLIALGETSQHETFSEKFCPDISAYICKTSDIDRMVGDLEKIWQMFNGRCTRITKTSQHPSEVFKSLSEREKMVIKYLRAGFTVTQIAKRNHRSIKTISTQKRTAMRKMGINTDPEIFKLELYNRILN